MADHRRSAAQSNQQIYHSAGMLMDDASSRGIGSNDTNETAIMVVGGDDHELDTDPGLGTQMVNDGSSIQRQLSAAAQAAVEEPSFNLRLIEAVKQSHCLYDASDRQYRSADYKIKVWNRLVHVLGFQGDARTLYNRWKQLRDKYGKEKKKLKYSGEYQSQWQYYKHLEFLDPHMVDRTQLRYERNKDGKNERQIVITDPNFTLHLINEVRLQPCLYDIKDPKYRHTEYRNQAWSEIVKNLAFPGDVNALYKQWKKVRDRYVREKRKLRMTSGVEQEEPNWDLYRELMWIDPYLEERAAQVKRKRESSELSGDEGLFMNDPFSSTINSSGMNDMNSSHSQSSQHHQQMQHYGMMQQSADHSGEGQAMLGGHQLQQLVKLQPGTAPGLQIQSQNTRIRTATGSSPIGTTSTLMMPIQAQQQHIPLGSSQQIHHQMTPQGSAAQHVIIANEASIDGDRAFAISVAADLLSLPEHARAMARAQIQHLLENSKITIVKA